MTIQSGSLIGTSNYVVPASGTTHAYVINGTASATPLLGDFQQVNNTGILFVPQGAFIDNTQGSQPLEIVLQPLGYTVTVAAGTSTQTQFPAPQGMSFQITGNGFFEIVWVDFPVLPSAQEVTIAGGTVNANVTNTVSTTSQATPNNGSAFIVQQNDLPITCYATTATTATSFSLSTGGVNSYNLYKLSLYLSSDAYTAAGGIVNIAINVTNSVGPLIFQKAFYVPSAGLKDDQGYVICDLTFEPGVEFTLGTNPIVVTTSTALTAGTYTLQAWVK